MVALLALLVGCEGGGRIGVFAPPSTPGGLTPAGPVTDPPAPAPTVPSTPGPIPLDPLFLAWFDPSVLHKVEIVLPAEVWSTLRDVSVPATVTLDGLELGGVGLALDGPDSEFGWNGKSDLDLDLLAFGGVRIADCVTLALDSQAADPAAVREVVAGQLLRVAAIPAQWSSFAEVYVNGDLVGLYTLREPVDSEFVRRRWHDAEGPLWRPGDYADFTAVGLEAFEDLNGSGDSDALVATRVAVEGETFWASAGAAVELPAFLAAWGWLDVLASGDGYPHVLGAGSWYGDPLGGGRLVYIPGSQDEAWGQTFRLDTPAGVLGQACLDDPTCDPERVAARDAALLAWDGPQGLAFLDAAIALTAAAVAADPSRGTSVAAVTTARTNLRRTLETWPGALGDL